MAEPHSASKPTLDTISTPVFDMKHIQMPAPNPERPKVLLIDNEVENLKVLTLLLEDQFELLCASSTAQAFELLDDLVNPSIVQLVICDLNMPKMSGAELFETIRLKLPSSLFLLLISTLNSNKIDGIVSKRRIFELITKPIEPSEFLQTVHKAITANQQCQKVQAHCDELSIEIQVISEQLAEKKRALVQAQAELLSHLK